MHDIRLIRDDPEGFDAGLARRGAEPVAKTLLALDEQRRALTTRLQEAQSRRNEASKAIGKAMGQGNTEEAEKLKAEVAELKQAMPEMEERLAKVSAELDHALAIIPNIPAADVPEGADEEDNVEVSRWGTPREFDFEPKEHADIAPALGMEFETGAKLSGARFTFLRGDMARLHRALGQFMLDRQVGENGYTECNPPVLVKDEAMYGTDKLPKFAEDSFQTAIEIDHASFKAQLIEIASKQVAAKRLGDDESEIELLDRLAGMAADQAKELRSGGRRWLIPTAEVSLTASVMGDILDADALPIRLTALTQCFRSEAGAAGRDTRGFIRQHQFEKCELVSIVKPEESEAEHQRMLACAQGVLEALGLPYRTMLLCTGDMGFGARKTYDLEVWLPGQGAWREISSCSNTGDFQARRMKTRYRPEGETKKTEFVHTLNGSGLAVGRTLVAVIENYQEADGSVAIPEALHPYMAGTTRLEPKS
ncbi:serine--tRNA ligase [Erythrobacter sp.]|uniref:serine--tRNA ligase n=1 Tax=Erythrobacter sp. TaxID=1042 RepID=UPI001425FBBF|nr:serine--tRNA ligase [Erythrobacter sp.]QIQ86965.1 MAG: serine--tRNA ligase [Erythrobacter sp.]